MLYSDGLATFSVFVEQIESNSMPIGASVVGATVAYHHRVMEGSHHYGVTVMGEVPAMTAMMVAESVRPTMTSDTK
jgi:sigma-E factor negative regulatory protein RseB